jgi:hypothetical protein
MPPEIHYYLYTFLALIFFHCLFDYPLQGDFLSKAKDKFRSIPGVPWYQALLAHSILQAGGVFYVTGSLILASIEFVLHACIDYMKCAGVFGSGERSYNIDQAAHIVCKIWYIYFLYWTTSGVIV